MKGTYLLVMVLPNDTTVMVGKQGTYQFQKGWYVYVGSALNGLEQRVLRHLRKEKKVHWHIDYFLPHVQMVNIFYKENNRREECRVASAFQRNFAAIAGFGCSDCCCSSHLFVGSLDEIQRTIASIGMEEYPLDEPYQLSENSI